MNERPILMNGPMVRATLADRKTQTRRVLNPQPEESENGFRWHTRQKEVRRGGGGLGVYGGSREYRLMELTRFCARMCPYGKPGDRLWVRETFQGPLFDYGRMEEYMRDRQQFEKPEFCVYAADGGDAPEFVDADDNHRCAWRPSIHMPRWACRILLEITDVRVQRLRDISEADAIAEGCKVCPKSGTHPGYVFEGTDYDNAELCHSHATTAFEILWDSINGDRASWDSNPWVWAITFKRLTP